MQLNRNQYNLIEDALVSASFYISSSIDAICDEDYLRESENLLTQVNSALELLKAIKNKG